MFKYIQWRRTFTTYLTNSLKKFPSSVSHIKLYCLRIVKQKTYCTDDTQKQSLKRLVQNEIVIYQFNNSKFFFKLNILSILNYIVWVLLGFSTYQLVSESPLKQDSTSEKSWFKDGNLCRIVKIFIVVSLALGAFLVVSVWFYTLRCIKTITLLKQSKHVLFETYTPMNTVRAFTVPLQQVSGVKSRHKVKDYMPLKINGKIFYFLVDLNGKFLNPSLFDSCIALKRNFN